MKRFWILVKKELKYGPIVFKIMTIGFALGYGIGFGIMSKLSDMLYYYMLSFTALLISLIGASNVLTSVGYDKQARTGEMILTTGVTIREYIYSKVLDSIITTVIGVLLFDLVFAISGGKFFKEGINFENILMPILATLVFSVFYGSFAIVFKVASIWHKLLMALFLLSVAVFAVVAMVGSFVKISLINGYKAVLPWTILLLFGMIILETGIRLLRIRDFVAK